MQVSNSNILERETHAYSAHGDVRYDKFVHGLKTFLTNLNVFAKFHSCMIGTIAAVDRRAQVATIIDFKTQRKIKVRYERSFEPFLLNNISERVEIEGKIHIDKNADPLFICSIERFASVDTSDIRLSQVLPDFLKLRSSLDTLITVELDECQQFYRARLPELKVYACGDNRVQLIERITERIEVCWDEFVRDDFSDLSVGALDLRERLLVTFDEVK